MKDESIVESITLNPVPLSQRKNWKAIVFVQAGLSICVPALMMGGILIDGMTFWSAIIADTIGIGIGVILSLFTGMQGSDLGVPAVVCCSSAFGKEGSRVINALAMFFSNTAWYGLQAAVCGLAFSQFMQSEFNIGIPVWISSLIWGIIMMISAVYGIRALEMLTFVTIPALVIISSFGMYQALHIKNLSVLQSYIPQNSISMIDGISLAIGFSVAAPLALADITRWQKNRKDTILSTTIGTFPPLLLLMIAGAVMAVVVGESDITLVMAKVGLPVLGTLILILSTCNTNAINSYSAGIDIVALFKLKDHMRAPMTLVAGMVGTLLAIFGILDYISNILYSFGNVLTPMIGVIIADYWIVYKGRKSAWKPRMGFYLPGILCWLAGVVVAIFIPQGFPMLNGLFVSLVSYPILAKLFPGKLDETWGVKDTE